MCYRHIRAVCVCVCDSAWTGPEGQGPQRGAQVSPSRFSESLAVARLVRPGGSPQCQPVTGAHKTSATVAFISAGIQGRIWYLDLAQELRRRMGTEIENMGVRYGEGVSPSPLGMGQQCPLLRYFFLIFGSRNAYFDASSGHSECVGNGCTLAPFAAARL